MPCANRNNNIVKTKINNARCSIYSICARRRIINVYNKTHRSNNISHIKHRTYNNDSVFLTGNPNRPTRAPLYASRAEKTEKIKKKRRSRKQKAVNTKCLRDQNTILLYIRWQVSTRIHV